jgi:hypothetical protein
MQVAKTARASAVAALVFVPAARAQISADPEIMMGDGCGGPSSSRDIEAAIVASPLNPNRVLVAWNRVPTGGGPLGPRVFYSLSTDGGNTFGCPDALPTPTCVTLGSTGTLDPMVACSYTSGELLAGGLVNVLSTSGPRQPGFVVRFPPAGPVQSVLMPADCAQAPFLDKGFLAAGPCPQGMPGCSGETWYLASVGSNGAPTSSFLRADSASGPPDQITSSSPVGYGHFPQVVRHAIPGLVPIGRVILGGAGDEPGSDQYIRPAITFSDDGGATWSPLRSFPFDRNVEPISGVGLPANPPIVPPGFRARGFPSVSLHPLNTATLIVAFPGRSPASADPDNIDIWLAISFDGGNTFTDPSGLWRIHHVTDDQLRLTGECCARSQELMPSVAIDRYGGVNLMVARTVSDPSVPAGTAVASIRYARWPSIMSLTQPPTVIDLSGPFTVAPGFSIGASGNDYHMVTTAGCFVWAAYAKTTPAGRPRVCVRRITLRPTCILVDIADFNDDGVVDNADPLAFAAALGAGLPSADINKDAAVDGADLAAYMAAFAAALNSPP